MISPWFSFCIYKKMFDRVPLALSPPSKFFWSYFSHSLEKKLAQKKKTTSRNHFDTLDRWFGVWFLFSFAVVCAFI